MLSRACAGDSNANEQLAGIVYPELRRIARNLMRFERPDHTLQPTAICHEAYLRLLADGQRTWENRVHFFACASVEMRRVVVDYARSRETKKRGGKQKRVSFENLDLQSPQLQLDVVLAVDQALTRLSQRDPRQSRVVEMRYFGGLTEDQVAEALNISVRSVKRDWSVARDWLYAELSTPAQWAPPPPTGL